MNERNERLSPRPIAIAIPMPYSAAFEFAPLREKCEILRDTLMVLSMQIVFRTVTFLRHLNY